MQFGKGDKQHLVIERGLERHPGEGPNGVPDDRFEGVYPGLAGAEVSPREDNQFFIIIQRDSDGMPRMHRCNDAEEARIFLEALLSKGIKRETLEVFHASEVPFNVSFRPVVDLLVS